MSLIRKQIAPGIAGGYLLCVLSGSKPEAIGAIPSVYRGAEGVLAGA